MSDPVTRLNAALEGRYRIDREIGAGGMATVYLADDVKHERQVALKVLKPELAAVMGAERFLAEIKTTANLQHPHIVALYDSGQADGFLYYVMPYIEGETLGDRLEREKQLPVEEAVRIATDVADALNAAHEQGVIHRDVKPANILLSRGRPLVADFGIALAVTAAGGGRLTQTGLSLGTPHYMSPEQATGEQHVGPPADIYALGCVLYEMLAGVPPFVGTSAQAILSKIITDSPDPITEHRKSVPTNVDSAIRCALERLPADRFPSVRQFADALANPGFRYGEADAEAGAALARRWKRITAGLASAALVLVAALGIQLAGGEASRGVSRHRLELPADPERMRFVMSPDGSRFVFGILDEAGDPPTAMLWTRARGELDLEVIPGTEHTSESFVFSPDGESLAFMAEGDLKVVSLDGSEPVTLVPSLGFTDLEWGEDGYIYGGYSMSTNPGLWRVPETGGVPEPVTDLTSLRNHADALPGGRGVLYTISGGRERAPDRIGVLVFDNRDERALIEGTVARYADSGHLVFTNAAGQLLAAPFDLGRLEITGSPTVILDNVVRFTLTDAGDLLYVQGTPRDVSPEVLWMDRDGNSELIDWTFDYPTLPVDPKLSPDGSRLALVVPQADSFKVLIRDLASGVVTPPLGGGNQIRPAWSEDGRDVGFAGTVSGDRGLWRARADGSGRLQRTMELAAGMDLGHRSLDQPTIVLEQDGGLWSFTAGTDTAPVPLLVDETRREDPTLSPDGRWLAYVAIVGDEPRIFVRPFPQVGAGRTQVSVGDGDAPRWSGNGGELYYSTRIGGAVHIMAARVQSDSDFSVTSRERLFPSQVGNLQGRAGWLFDVNADGDRFVIVRYRTTEAAYDGLILVENWFEELRERVGR